MPLPDGVTRLRALAGQVWIQASARTIEAGAGAALGLSDGQDVPFVPAPGAPPPPAPLRYALELPETAPVRVTALGPRPAGAGGSRAGRIARAVGLGRWFGRGRAVEARVNGLGDWMLENGRTAQIMMRFPDQSAEMTLGRALELPAGHGALTFRAAMAVHRARAVLHVDITPQGQPARRVDIPFDPARPGGRFRGGYQQLALPLEPSDTGTRIALSISYQGYGGHPGDVEPFVFVADPEAVSDPRAGRVPEPLEIKAPPQTADAHSDPWWVAPLPAGALGGAQTARLITHEGAADVIAPNRTRLTILREKGHVIEVEASQPGRYGVFIDGAEAFMAEIGTHPAPLRIPTRFLTGQVRLISLRDASGTQVLCERFILLPRMLTPEDVMQRESRAPFPGALGAQAAHRYDAMRAALADPGPPEQMQQLGYALSVLEGGYERVRLKPLVLERPDAPEVSVIIPAHNKVEVTYAALAALVLARCKTSFEVVVVDDASSDDTARLEQIVEGITVVRNTQPQRFIRACNAGVAAARGRYVVLLNNDTEPTAGWLDALVDAFTRFDRVGLVGAKLVYPNGMLQDAGGIIWNSGNPWNYGNQQNPWDPRFCYARQADYLSGAALMTTREIWDQVGGLSAYMEPMYFEDTDFAFKVREAGYTTWFVPDAVVYHYEGMTSGTDVSTGYKRYQEINRPKFKDRWKDAYAGFGEEGVLPDLEKDRGIAGRVLFIDYATPRPDRDAGSYAALQEVRLVQSLGYKVTFLPQNLAHIGAYTDALQRDGIEVITAPFFRSVEDFLAARGAEFDAFYVTRYYVGQAVLDTLRQVAPQTPVIFNNADLHFLRRLRAGMVAGDSKQIEEAGRIREEELAVMRRCDLVLSYNEVEHSVIQSHTNGAVRVATCPWVLDTPPAGPGFAPRAGISFLGSFMHHPNGEALKWFAAEVMPRLAKARPDIELSVYGAGMGEDIRALAGPNIRTEGFVPEIADAYHRHRVFVAPLLSGAGIKGKVLSALAHGLPCVLSPVAAEGVGLRHGHDCLIAQDPDAWVKAILSVYDDADAWSTMASAARSYALETYSFEKGQALMGQAFASVGLNNGVA